MFKPWINIPAEDIRIKLPLSLYDKDVQIMFKNVEAIDRTIMLLEDLKVLLAETERQNLHKFRGD